MGVVEFTRRDSAPADTSIEGEHPHRVVADVARRPHHFEQVITVANEKGGAGKTTLAAHIAVSLASAGYRVLAIDLDRRQRSLSRFFASRDATARRLGVGLPMIRHLVLNQTSGAMLFQEIARAGPDCQVVVIDAPGADSPIVRRAIAMADKLVTPVNLSFVDLDLLAHLNPVTRDFVSPGCFAEAVQGLAETRAEMGMAATDWIVVPNRLRGGAGGKLGEACLAALGRISPRVGFRIGSGMTERAAYRDLQLLGLTQLDLQHIPSLPRAHTVARREILRLHSELQLDAPGEAKVRKRGLVPA